MKRQFVQHPQCDKHDVEVSKFDMTIQKSIKKRPENKAEKHFQIVLFQKVTTHGSNNQQISNKVL